MGIGTRATGVHIRVGARSFYEETETRQCSELFSVMIREKEIRCAGVISGQELFLCTHEEAASRMLLHATDGAKQGCKRIVLRTVDTDVVELAVSTANKLTCGQLIVSF